MTSEAPERIWATGNGAMGSWNSRPVHGCGVDEIQYVRADLSPQWRPISEAPRDGAEFQAWIVRTDGYNVSFWEPRCRFNEHGAFEIYGRVDYDEDGWESWSFLTATHFMPLPEAPK